jgi:hypothetical protein
VKLEITSLLAGMLIFGGCAANYQLTEEERAILGEYTPPGASFGGTELNLASDHSFTALIWTDVGPQSKSYSGRWALRRDTLVLNSEPTPKHKNYTMSEMIASNHSDVFIRVLNLDSTRILYEHRTSEKIMSSPNPFFQAAIESCNGIPCNVVVGSMYGEHRIPISSPQANIFTAFVQVPVEVPEFIAEMKFLIQSDGKLSKQLPNGKFGVYLLERK